MCRNKLKRQIKNIIDKNDVQKAYDYVIIIKKEIINLSYQEKEKELLKLFKKMGANKNTLPPKTPVSFVLLDNSHLDERGIKYFCAKSKEFVLMTSNKNHPAYSVNEENLHILYQEKFSLKNGLYQLKNDFSCERLTVQSGGTVNSIFLREKLIDFVDIVLAPVLIGGKDTSTLIDGKSIMSEKELASLGVLKLLECKTLSNSYIRLRYRVIS